MANKQGHHSHTTNHPNTPEYEDKCVRLFSGEVARLHSYGMSEIFI